MINIATKMVNKIRQNNISKNKEGMVKLFKNVICTK